MKIASEKVFDPTVRASEPGPWPEFAPDEVDAARRVLESGSVNYWTGSEGREFEREFAEWVGADHAIAVANGTVALEGALLAAGVQCGDEVIVSPRTFLASASAIVKIGARPVFADVDEDTQNIHPESVGRVLTPETRAIVAVHLAGWPADIPGLRDLSSQRDLIVIEDAAQAHGARLGEAGVGSMGHVAAFSFCQDKIMTTAGEGGMITTNDEEIWRRAWSHKDHGKSYDAVYNRDHPPGFRWLHEDFGTNWRLSEVQSAVGRRQLAKLPDWLRIRRDYAKAFDEAFESLDGVRTTVPPPDVLHAYYKYYCFVRPDALKSDWDRDRIMNEVTARGVPCYSGSCSEIYLEKAFDGTGYRPESRLPVAKRLGETSLMLLLHPTQPPEFIDRSIEVFRDVVREADR